MKAIWEEADSSLPEIVKAMICGHIYPKVWERQWFVFRVHQRSIKNRWILRNACNIGLSQQLYVLCTSLTLWRCWLIGVHWVTSKSSRNLCLSIALNNRSRIFEYCVLQLLKLHRQIWYVNELLKFGKLEKLWDFLWIFKLAYGSRTKCPFRKDICTSGALELFAV